MNTTFHHLPVLAAEVIDSLNIKPDGIYVDCTVGGAGHSLLIAEKLTTGRLICLDQDENAINAATTRLASYGEMVKIVHSNFEQVGQVLKQLGIEKIDGALIDLGISSHQIDEAERGFSYMKDAPLDMRMDRRQTLTAYDIVNSYSQEELARILRIWGEEKFAGSIARRICEQRNTAPINTTLELASIIERALPTKERHKGSHPAKKTFQALRIEVNRELDIIQPTLKALCSHLSLGGRLCVISFHSLEDRIVKTTFADFASQCVCSKKMPVCTCGKQATAKIVGKSVTASEEELLLNQRAKSARLRVIEKI